MKLETAKQEFILRWGTIGSQWGINRTMAQVHALLLTETDALSADEVMEQLDISRGNANMNLRALIDWGLVKKLLKPGERKEFFYAEKDIWKIARQVKKERKKRELEPLIEVFKELQQVDENTPEAKAFKKMTKELYAFSVDTNKILDRMIAAESSLIMKTLIKLLK